MNNPLAQIAAIVGPQGVLSDPKEVETYTKDWRGRYQGKTSLVVKPGCAEEISSIVNICADAKIAIVPQGGNTSLCGASVPTGTANEIIINLSRLNQIRKIDPENNTITVEAGCTLAQVQRAAASVDRLFPLSFGPEEQCQIGGNLSTNAGGVAVLHYGNIRAMTLGLEVVLPSGEVWNGLRSLYKDNTGYDLKHLFIGAEGTLGIITAAVLKLFPRPKGVATAFVAMKDVATAIQLLNLMHRLAGDKFTSFEFIPRLCLDLVFKHVPNLKDPFDKNYPAYVLVEFSETLASDNPDQILFDLLKQAKDELKEIAFVVAKDKEQVTNFWGLRKKIAEAERAEGFAIKHDISVPVSNVAKFLNQAEGKLKTQFPGVTIIAFGHLGDGNIHYNVLMATNNEIFVQEKTCDVNNIVYDLVTKLGGSISAEHGIGQLKRDTLRQYRSSIEIETMRAIKRTLDPNNIMNPGKVI